MSLAAIRRAAAGIRGIAVRTPLLRLDVAGAELGASVYLKPEMLQLGGAFKFRGAFTFLAQLDPGQRAKGVIAPSSGNHAQAVALAARLFGVSATVVMPETVTPAKRRGAERLGARVVLAGTTTQHRLERALELAAAEELVLVPPFDDPVIISGQGTVGLEIVEDLPNVDTVLVPVGGGGLSAGVATAVKAVRPQARVIGVEPAGAAKLSAARQAGHPVTLERTASIADGLTAVRIGTIPFRHHLAFLDDVVTVPDEAIPPAMRLLLDRAKVVAEPSGAITLAALLAGRVASQGDTVAVLSGGNVEWPDLQRLLGA